MDFLRNRCRDYWKYIIHHKWSKDILRGNLLYILLVILYDFGHLLLPWRPIRFSTFLLFLCLLNLCLFFKRALDIIDGQMRH